MKGIQGNRNTVEDRAVALSITSSSSSWCSSAASYYIEMRSSPAPDDDPLFRTHIFSFPLLVLLARGANGLADRRKPNLMQPDAATSLYQNLPIEVEKGSWHAAPRTVVWSCALCTATRCDRTHSGEPTEDAQRHCSVACVMWFGHHCRLIMLHRICTVSSVLCR